MAFPADLLNHTVTYWPPGSLGASGQPAPGAAATMDGRWEERTELFIDARGAEVRSQAVVYVASDVALNGWLALGNQTATANPRTLAGAYSIRGFKKVSDVEGAT